MKKILLIMAIILPMIALTACSDDESKETTYTLKWDMDFSGGRVDVWMFEYNDKDEIVQNSIVDDIQSNHTESFKAKDNATKVKVKVKMSAYGASKQQWIQQVYYLNAGGNVDININGDTLIGNKEP